MTIRNQEIAPGSFQAWREAAPTSSVAPVICRPMREIAREVPVTSAIASTGEHATVTSSRVTSISISRGPWLA